MEFDTEKIDEIVLALLYLTTFKSGPNWRAWKGHDWDALNRLYEKDLISYPKSAAKSISLSDEARELSEKLFKKHFSKTDF